ncbi:transcriptional regulator GcvA [Jannaschia formosa]|uniref:transcriptional regulator GcvA n=1 Tax=Jannaschia formosa TaxID=2259592 RepID=UPI000E1BCDAF|nr:transcriptional regulator GcvA [Jannaschia formosa]TFL19887.1 transcriptional regulator GcvA [Jannaschia formosa]
MSDRLPPLTALRAFEAAARHLSFQEAANELAVTPAALSFQIKSLEAHLGAPLFRRLNRRVELTEAGQALAGPASEGFQTLATGWRAARRVLDSGLLTITAGPAFTAKWLAPRLFDFAQRHPEIELRFAATLKILDFATDDIDIAIRFGPDEGRRDAGLHQALTIREWVTPMMHPDLAARYPTPASLIEAPIIFDDSISFLRDSVGWGPWFRANGVAPADLHGPHFSQADHAIDAAQAGAGVVLGRVSLAEAALRHGQLVAPFEIALVPQAEFRVLCPKGAETRPNTRAFLDWLAVEVRRMDDHRTGRRMLDATDLPS